MWGAITARQKGLSCRERGFRSVWFIRLQETAGTGAKPHTHPNEQFNYLLKGKLKAMVNGQEQMVTAGTLIHIPANVVHATVATTDEDVIFLAMKDMSWGIAGTAVDKEDPGPYYEPGFEPDKKTPR